VRQPLHHASGALQAASMALDTAEPNVLDQAEHRLLRAQTVLGKVQAVLDNTLTASEMLTRQHAAARDDCDLGVLVALALGDLPLEQRQRVQLLWETPVRTVLLDPVLTRLALRNLLQNALSHGGAAAQVILRVGESDHPPAMRLTVEDDGPGLAAAHRQAQADTAWPAQDGGLGLFIVRQVMALHGGSLLLSARSPRGLRATLAFPEPA
jgi:two-component system sensor histidine kinase TctE